MRLPLGMTYPQPTKSSPQPAPRRRPVGPLDDTDPGVHRGVLAADVPHVDVRGARIPALGFGTWQMTGAECARAVEDALELGYRHIDTARMYENEAAVGRALTASGLPRDAIFLASKIWWERADADGVRASVHAMIRDLSVDHLDLCYLHWPNPDVPLRETLEAMRALQEEGAIRHLGVSNFTPTLLDEALRIAPITALQVEYHPFLAQDDLRRLCQRHELALVAYSPLARGNVHGHPRLKAIGERHGKSPEQVTLRWLTQQHHVAAIPKASSRAHRAANLAIFDFELSAEEAQAISELARGERIIDPSFAPEWEQ